MTAGPAGPEARCVLVIYARIPARGQVKTRLRPRFSDLQALRLHEAMLADTIETMRAACAGLAELRVSWSGEPPIPERPFLPARDLPAEMQHGASLGERMRNTIAARLADGFGQVVLVGSDTPHLPGSIVREAFHALDAVDVAIGPAEDGGYYLIGARADHPRLFEDIPWGSAAVLDLTRQRLGQAGLTHRELRTWYDVDTPDDARRLLRDPASAGSPRRTREVLEQILGGDQPG